MSISRRWLRFPLICVAAIFLTTHAAPIASAADPQQWIASWGCAPQLVEQRNLPPAPGLSGNTLRQVVHLSAGGDVLRVRLSNAYGDGPVTITSAHLALSDGGSAIRAGTDKPITFNGRPDVTIPPGALMLSDDLPLACRPMSDLTVTIQFAHVPRNVTGHPGSRCTSYLQAGDHVSDPNLSEAASTAHWYVLTGIDLSSTAAPPAAPGTIVILGDSITDGRGSGTDKNDRWPDDLERRLAAAPADAALGVLNQGIGGNRLLNDGLGPSALARFDRDIAAQANARWLIVLEGINDIGTAPPADISTLSDRMIGAYRQIIARAHTQHLAVYGATILPFDGAAYFNPDRENVRQHVNDWIRHGGVFDQVIDFDQAMRNPDHPSQLAAPWDSGDHLHPNEAGYQHMAEAIDLQLFQRP